MKIDIFNRMFMSDRDQRMCGTREYPHQPPPPSLKFFRGGGWSQTFQRIFIPPLMEILQGRGVRV